MDPAFGVASVFRCLKSVSMCQQMSALGELSENPCLHEQGHAHLYQVGHTCVHSSWEVLRRKNPPRLCKASSCTGREMPSAVVMSSGTMQAVPHVPDVVP